MKLEKFTVQACCGMTSVIFKTDQPLTKIILSGLVRLGFLESNHFTIAGILYVSSPDLVITGPLGSNRLQVKCKNDNCEQKIKELEELLKNL